MLAISSGRVEATKDGFDLTEVDVNSEGARAVEAERRSDTTADRRG